ncbi:MAG: transcription antitermination factor NusB [Nitrospirae bacterium]|nr:transcription antitermination factor NusB [Nitrospirota bacterium]
MGARRRARELALQVLYESEFRALPAHSILSEICSHSRWSKSESDRAKVLVEGVGSHAREIDDLIGRVLENWRLDRLHIMDRNVLRLGVYELRFCKDVPPKVAIDEAIEVAKKFGTADSGGFVNGILDRVLSSGSTAHHVA